MTIGIAGGSASGKTTLCNRLAEKLKNEEPKIFHMDEYFKPEKLRPRARALCRYYYRNTFYQPRCYHVNTILQFYVVLLQFFFVV